MPRQANFHASRQQEPVYRGRVTRSRGQVDRIESEYGAVDIPTSHPLHAKREAAMAKHRQALDDYQERFGA